MKAEIQNDVTRTNSEILNLNLNHYIPVFNTYVFMVKPATKTRLFRYSVVKCTLQKMDRDCIRWSISKCCLQGEQR